MTDALSEVSPGPQTDTLAPQVEPQKPVENQTPPTPEPAKPEAKLSPDEKRAATIKAAMEKAKVDDKPAEVKPKDAAAKEPVKDAKPEAVKERAPDGKFQPKATDAPAATEPAPEPKPTAFKAPPSRFDDAARAEWEAVPEGTRGAIHRMVREADAGIQKYKADAEAFEPVRQYHEMAKQSGTDLPTALGRYVNIEQELRRDPISGLQAVVANLGIKGPNGQPVTLRDIAAHVLGQPADKVASRAEAQTQTLTREIEALKRQLGSVTQHVQTQQTEAKTSAITSEWQSFVAENPRATELEAEMAEFLRGFRFDDSVSVKDRLAKAYRYAAASAPEPIVAHTDTPPLAQTQPAPKAETNPAGRKSISGAPNGSVQKAPQKRSRSEAIRAAMTRAGLAT